MSLEASAPSGTRPVEILPTPSRTESLDAMLARGSWQEALHFARDEYELRPENPSARLRFAMCLTGIGQHSRALVLLQMDPPCDPATSRLQAELLRHLGRPVEASNLLRGLLRTNPRDMNALHGLVRTEIARDRDAAAHILLDRGREIASDDQEAMLLKILLRHRTQDPFDDLLILAEALAPSSEAAVQELLGWQALDRNRLAEAEERFGATLHRDPLRIGAREGLLTIARLRGLLHPVYRMASWLAKASPTSRALGCGAALGAGLVLGVIGGSTHAGFAAALAGMVLVGTGAWTAPHLTDLAAMADRAGRQALSGIRVCAALLVGLILALSTVLLVLTLPAGASTLSALASGLLASTAFAARAFHCRETKWHRLHATLAAVLVVLSALPLLRAAGLPVPLVLLGLTPPVLLGGLIAGALTTPRS